MFAGKTEVQADAVLPVPGRPGQYAVVIGGTCARFTTQPQFTVVRPKPPTAVPQTRTPLEQVIFVQGPTQH